MSAGMLPGVLKSGAARSAELLGLTALARRGQRGLRILMYHGVLPGLEGPAGFGGLFVTAGDFAQQMRHVRDHYQVVDLRLGVRTLAAGGALPERAIAITFDDGYRNTISAALPVLQSLRLPATVFVVAGMAGGPELVWFDALRILVTDCAANRRAVDLGSGISVDGGAIDNPENVWTATLLRIRGLAHDEQETIVARLGRLSREEGWVARHPEFALADWDEWRAAGEGVLRIGSHTGRHGDLRLMPASERVDDLRESKRRIEEELSVECESIAYPYGSWDEDVALAARQAGYSCGLTTDEGVNAKGGDAFALRRTMIGDKGSLPLFNARVSGLWDAIRGRRRPA